MLKWSREQFQDEARRLVLAFRSLERSDHCSESFVLKGWSLEQDPNNGNNYFLSHSPVQRDSNVIQENETSDILEEELCDEAVLQDYPELVLPQSTNNSKTSWYFSIVYSDTWKAPILYFNIDDQNGSPCPRSHVVKLLMGFSHYNRVEDAWEFLSQEEHPVTRLPSFFLHPCRTMDRLQTLIQPTNNDGVTREENYTEDERASSSKKEDGHPFLLLCWMSLILPSVGYPIPSTVYQKVGKHFAQDDDLAAKEESKI